MTRSQLAAHGVSTFVPSKLTQEEITTWAVGAKLTLPWTLHRGRRVDDPFLYDVALMYVPEPLLGLDGMKLILCLRDTEEWYVSVRKGGQPLFNSDSYSGCKHSPVGVHISSHTSLMDSLKWLESFMVRPTSWLA